MVLKDKKMVLKKWLGIQKHGVTDTAIFHPYMLGVKNPSQMYLEAHAGTLAMIRIKGDPLVTHTVNSRLERETGWTKKFSTTKTVHKMWEDNINKSLVAEPSIKKTQGNILVNVKAAKKAMKSSVKQETIQYWNTRVKKLTFQGDFVKLLIEEKENVTWQSVSNNIPKGVLSFALKACSNGLNTPDNLKRWGKRKTSKCELCGNYSNLEHKSIINSCKRNQLKIKHNQIMKEMSKISLLCSFAIYQAHCQPSWQDPPLLSQ